MNDRLRVALSRLRKLSSQLDGELELDGECWGRTPLPSQQPSIDLEEVRILATQIGNAANEVVALINQES